MNKTIIASALLLAGIAGLTSCGSEKKSASVPAIDLTNMDRYIAEKNAQNPEYRYK